MRDLPLLLVLLCTSLFSSAQSTANSPYSSFGLGELGGLDHAVFGAMGNSNISFQDSTVVNFYNPSSYSSLGVGQPIFSLGFSSRLSSYSENGNSYFSPLAGVQHFVMGIPFARRFGLAFGLKPFSRRGYESSQRIQEGDDSLYYNYLGTGGINDVFLGFAADVIKMPNTRLSLGVHGSYLFGAVTNTRKSGLIQSALTSTNYAGGVGMKSLRSNSFHYELGLSFEQRINANHELGVYATIDPLQKIKGKYVDELYYALDINDPESYDTLYYNDTASGNITNVPSYSFALMYRFNFKANKGETKELSSELSFHIGYTIQDWSKYEDRYDPNFVNGFQSTTKYTLGIQYVPEVNFTAGEAKSKYYHRMRYRIGGYYQTLPYTTSGEQVKDFGTTFGFGFPVAINRTLSSVNLGFSIGSRGVADGTALKEQYYGINIALLIAPTAADKWFIKRKLN